MTTHGWRGVDLDGTLAEYGTEHQNGALVGKPIMPMVLRVRRWLVHGDDIRIFTARANPSNPNLAHNLAAIDAWCEEQFGRKLPITCQKDFMMVELWDDRAIQVEFNTGRRMDGVRDL